MPLNRTTINVFLPTPILPSFWIISTLNAFYLVADFDQVLYSNLFATQLFDRCWGLRGRKRGEKLICASTLSSPSSLGVYPRFRDGKRSLIA